MTDVIKTVVIVTDSACATGHTVDFNMDAADAKGRVFQEILGSSLQNATGTTVASATWSNSTGILTMPSISTGIHKLTVWGY